MDNPIKNDFSRCFINARSCTRTRTHRGEGEGEGKATRDCKCSDWPKRRAPLPTKFRKIHLGKRRETADLCPFCGQPPAPAPWPLLGYMGTDRAKLRGESQVLLKDAQNGVGRQRS